MKKILLPVMAMLLLSLSLANAIQLEDKLYYVTLHYSGSEITNDKVDVKFGQTPTAGESKGYRLVLFDAKEKELYSLFFSSDLEMEIFPKTGENTWGGRFKKEEFDNIVLIPYFTEGKIMKVYNPDGKEIRAIDVSCTMHCNQDDKCNGREDNDICPSDCKPGEKGAIRKYIDGDPVTEKETGEWSEEECSITQIRPLPGVERITIKGAPAGITDISKLVKLQQVPVIASTFTKFTLLLGVEPLADFTEMTLELGYTCVGPRYNVFKCADWDFAAGRCRNDSAWDTFMNLPQGLVPVNITLRSHDPGLGIGPSPFVPYCGDEFCDADESARTCAVDCGRGGEQKTKGLLEQLISFLTGSATACVEQWECTEWGQYNAAGERTRKCTDKNKCGTASTKSSETETCQWGAAETEKKSSSFFSLLMVLLLCGLVLFVWKLKRKFK